VFGLVFKLGNQATANFYCCLVWYRLEHEMGDMLDEKNNIFILGRRNTKQ
jgi:hypothetical protein